MRREPTTAAPAALAQLGGTGLVVLLAVALVVPASVSFVKANVTHRFPAEPPLQDVPAGSVIARPFTSRMRLPLSVVKPSRNTGSPPSFASSRAT